MKNIVTISIMFTLMFNIAEACDRPTQGNNNQTLHSNICDESGITIAYCDNIQVVQGCSDCENCTTTSREETQAWEYGVDDTCDATHYIKQGSSSCALKPPMRLSSKLSVATQNTLAIYVDASFDKSIAPTRETMKNLSTYVYEYFNDSFDFLFIVSNNVEIPDAIHYYGIFYPVKNSIGGIGKSMYDSTSYYGSDGKLQGMMHFPYRKGINNGPTLHELSHNWANSLINTGMGGHWNYTGFFAKTSTGAKGQLGGFDASTFIDKGNGNYSAIDFGTYANRGNSIPYNDVELYLMGLIGLDDVGDVLLSTNAKYDKYVDNNHTFTADSVVRWEFPSLIDDLGVGDRDPSSEDSQKSFRILTLLVGNTIPTEAEIEEVNSYINKFTLNTVDNNDRFYNFYEATGGIGSLEANSLRSFIK